MAPSRISMRDGAKQGRLVTDGKDPESLLEPLSYFDDLQILVWTAYHLHTHRQTFRAVTAGHNDYREQSNLELVGCIKCLPILGYRVIRYTQNGATHRLTHLFLAPLR